MKSVPRVPVDLVLDPYVMNVFPRSLVPTAGWIVVVAGVAWAVGGVVVRLIRGLVREVERSEEEEGKKKS
jgi:hypothetical protein